MHIWRKGVEFSFLEITAKEPSEDQAFTLHSSQIDVFMCFTRQVCSDANFDFILNYAVTFAHKLPTKKEVKAGCCLFYW